MVHATAYADLTSSLTSAEQLQYADWNSSHDTFQVASYFNSLSPHELFNFAADYSATGQSVATYNNAADFYAERGFKSLVSNWTVSEDSQIFGMYRTTGGAHSLDLTNSTGTVWNPITVGQGMQRDTRENWIASLDSSRNINVGDLGAVNMTLTASWKTNAANDDPVWLDGLSDAEKESDRNWGDGLFYDGYSSTIYGDQPELHDGVIRMLAYDVSDLVKAMGYDIENAFMFTWEDGHDFDYNDMVYIMTNVTPNTTPEPATMLIFGLGLAGVAAARRMKRK